MNITQDHFRPGDQLTDEQARNLFAQSVSLVEIETFTFCNRTCHFCPNKDMPFRQDKAGGKFMDTDLYSRILRDLHSISYTGSVTYSRYNEPLAERDTILARIREARMWLPQSFLFTHTNGDYLTRDYLDALRIAGLNRLAVQSYLGNDERWDDKRMLARQTQQLKRLGLSVKVRTIHHPGVRYMVVTDYPDMEVTLDARNFDAIGTDRGGLVQINVQQSRQSPCFVPFTAVYIDWNGSVVPCCNLRSDVPSHAPYVVANLSDGTSIFRAWADLHAWRRSLLTFGDKKPPCSTCAYESIAYNPQLDANLNRLHEKYVKGIS